MIINSQLDEIFDKFKIRKEEGLCYLLCMYYFSSTIPSYIPDSIKSKIISTNIFTFKDGIITWNIPLFAEHNIHFEWVKTEYVPLFTKIGKLPHTSECITRMQSFFSTHPDVRKEEIIEATKLYVSSIEVSYIRQPHYFIYKGVGKERTYDLYQYILLYREKIKVKTDIKFIGNKMQ